MLPCLHVGIKKKFECWSGHFFQVGLMLLVRLPTSVYGRAILTGHIPSEREEKKLKMCCCLSCQKQSASFPFFCFCVHFVFFFFTIFCDSFLKEIAITWQVKTPGTCSATFLNLFRKGRPNSEIVFLIAFNLNHSNVFYNRNHLVVLYILDY